MADGDTPSDEAGRRIDQPQDPIVERLRKDPAKPPQPAMTLKGFLGDSDRRGIRRLYFSRRLDHYAEFRIEDVVYSAPIPAGQQPFLGDEATVVAIRRDSTVEYTRTRSAQPVDDFDLDVRLGGRAVRASDTRGACAHTDCDFATCGGTCATCESCFTFCDEHTCNTTDACDTQGEQTCAATCTCQTNCGRQSCNCPVPTDFGCPTHDQPGSCVDTCDGLLCIQ